MNVEEARKVLWLKSNPRPLGELLDEGYLTQDRLEWAAQWAYNQKLKQAAQVLLDTMGTIAPEAEEKPRVVQEILADNSLPIKITLDKARTTAWPFPPYKGQPMGILVESKQLSLKDLGYAVENAWDERVRQAATALALVRLEQAIKEPTPSAGFVHVYSGGRSYSERSESYFTLLQGTFFGLIIAFMIYLVSVLIRGFGKPNPKAISLTEFISTPGGFLSLILALVFLLFGVWFINFAADTITKRLDKQIEAHRLGQEGEEKTVQLVVQALNGNWNVFRNLRLPGRNKGDLDIVLVGPPGVWVLEVKNFRGKYRNVGDRWEYRKGMKWKAANVNPSQQAFKNAIRLRNFFDADHLKVFVNAVVVWASEENQLVIENPSTPVWSCNRLLEELGNIWQGERLLKLEREKIISKLTKLCEEQKSKDAR